MIGSVGADVWCLRLLKTDCTSVNGCPCLINYNFHLLSKPRFSQLHTRKRQICAAMRLLSTALLGLTGLTSSLALVDANCSAPIVDLGYSRYQGYCDPRFDANVYKGIRFAASPKRWQRPEAPRVNRTSIIQAVENPPRCPQCLPTSAFIPVGNFTETILGDEDCLFLNVFSPKGAAKLPVLFWIRMYSSLFVALRGLLTNSFAT